MCRIIAVAFVQHLVLASLSVLTLFPPRCDSSDAPQLLRALVGSARSLETLVLLWATEPASRESRLWVENLQMPVIQWTRFGKLELQELTAQVNRSRRVLVLVPESRNEQRNDLFIKLNGVVFDLSLVRFVLQLRPGERLPYDEFPELSCLLVGVNDTTIDVSRDGFRSCTQRKPLQQPAELFDYNKSPWYSVFNMRKLIIVTEVTTTSVNVYTNYTIIPESLLLMNTLRYFNATIIPYHFKGTGKGQDRLHYKVHRKEVDISLFPAGLSEDLDALIDVRAINAFRSIKFISRKGTQVPPRMIHTLLSSGYLLSAVAGSALLVLSVYFCQSPLLGFRTSLTACLLFLFSTLVGRGYPEPPPSRSNGTRLLVLFWAFGMLSFCAYLQSMITSEVNVPTVERKIKNTEDLLKFAKAKRVFPCLERGSFSERFISTSPTEIGTELLRSFTNCRDCVNTKSGRDTTCVLLAKRGTHVYVRVYDDISAMFWYQHDLMVSEDSFRFLPNAPMIAKGFPCGPALKRLVVELREHGHQEKLTSMRMWIIMHTFAGATSDRAVMAPISFWDHFLIYACGFLLACSAFLLELCCGRRKRVRD